MVSQGTNIRIDGIRAAAHASGVQLQTPCQLKIRGRLINTHLEPDAMVARKTDQTWTPHVNLLKRMVSHGWSSMLILEDDIDWDVNIRNKTRNIAATTLALTGEENDGQTPYGLGWDLIWMSQYGDSVRSGKPETNKGTPGRASGKHRSLDDHITAILGEGAPCVDRTGNNGRSLGYAISNKGARELLSLAPLAQRSAFDLTLMSACLNGSLRCISVSPGVFAQYTIQDSSVGEVQSVNCSRSSSAQNQHTIGSTPGIRQSSRRSGLTKPDRYAC